MSDTRATQSEACYCGARWIVRGIWRLCEHCDFARQPCPSKCGYCATAGRRRWDS